MLSSFVGSAGQSFGCFLAPGMNIRLVGEGNDYVGKVSLMFPFVFTLLLCCGLSTRRFRNRDAFSHAVLMYSPLLKGPTIRLLYVHCPPGFCHGNDMSFIYST